MRLPMPFGLPRSRVWLAGLLLPALAACTDDSDYDFDASIDAENAAAAAASAPVALYDPGNGVVPFPDNLLFAGSEDGTLNVPIDPTASASTQALTQALNDNDGFSTIEPITTSVSESLDVATIAMGDTVRMFEVSTSPAGAVTGIVSELAPTDVLATYADGRIVLVPVQPLAPSTTYLVVLTDSIIGSDGEALTPTLTYSLLKGNAALEGPAAPLEPLRQGTLAALAAVAGEGVEASEVVLSWTFTTTSVREVLQAAEDAATASTLAVQPTGQTTGDVSDQLAGKADLYVGQLVVPYYLEAVDDDTDAATAIESFWTDDAGNALTRANPAPAATGTETIPVLATVPNGASVAGGTAPAGGWPVVIFQHGITRDRTDMLAIADALADAGLVTIAIDLPVHGITDTTNPLFVGTDAGGLRERHFGIDLASATANGTTLPGPDGEIDPSGTHYYNLQALRNARDNVRQSVSDLFVLSASLGSAQGLAMDASRKTFIGYSLGGIVGTTFLSYDDTVSAATLAMPGGGIVGLIENGERSGAVLQASLGSAGAPPGSDEYAQFLTIAQTVIDPADPINHARSLAGSGTALHFIEVLNDQTVVNSVADDPLIGSTPLARLLGLTRSDQSLGGSGWYRFDEPATHGSLIDPTPSPAATVEMQRQTAAFAQSQGTVLPVTDQSVILAP